MDKIHVNGIPCAAYIGVTEDERAAPQEIQVHVALSMDLEPAANTDDVKLTVDYRGIVSRVQETVQGRQFHLLEALVYRVCRAILEDPRIESVQVTAEKRPRVLAGKVDHVAVEMKKGR